MKITRIKPTTVTVPLEAPLRHRVGCHWGRFVRTIVEVETECLVGLGEMGGGGESAEAAFKGLEQYLIGHDPMQLEALYWKICNRTGSLDNNRTQLHAAIEFACIDLIGKKLGLRACDLLGGALREEVPFASYLFVHCLRVAGRSSYPAVAGHASTKVWNWDFMARRLSRHGS